MTARPAAIAHWLFAVAALVFLMVVVGGITRLTESGLSITEWNLVTGVLPPLSEAGWVTEFAKYKATPEYREVNRGMSMADFQFIYFWEWAHRLLGRLIGLAFALPLAWFAWKRAIPKGYGWRLAVLLLLGGMQGAIGWWMVVSGLADRTDVSHFRLAVHLLLALFILAALVWTALDLKRLAGNPASQPANLTTLAAATAAILFIQLLFGAWTAGLNAGLAADDWPLMNGRLLPDIPPGGLLYGIANDPFLIHWVHRWWAWVAVAALVVMARYVKRAGGRGASVAIHSAFGVQVLLGIATVMTGIALSLAVLHQAVGALLVASVAWGAHVLGRQEAGR